MRGELQRQKALLDAIGAVLLLGAIGIGGMILAADAVTTNLQESHLPPSLHHPFGTDWLGRDMFARTIKGLSLSIMVGVIGASCSVIIAVILGLSAALMGKAADRLITWLIDLFLSVPHMVLLILIAFVCGGGMKGIVIGVALTHWPSLARVIRAETLQLKSSDFIRISRHMGKSGWWVSTRHMGPHLLPQVLVGFLLLFPHAILHEAAITFLGLGLSPHQPAIGVILSESMRYLSMGMWWLAVFPGLGLLLVVLTFDRLGEHLRLWFDPYRPRG